MKAEALTDATIELPKSRILVELPNGQRTSATGFVISEDRHGELIIIIKSGKKLIG
jgi:hypothetical protein